MENVRPGPFYKVQNVWTCSQHDIFSSEKCINMHYYILALFMRVDCARCASARHRPRPMFAVIRETFRFLLWHLPLPRSSTASQPGGTIDTWLSSQRRVTKFDPGCLYNWFEFSWTSDIVLTKEAVCRHYSVPSSILHLQSCFGCTYCSFMRTCQGVPNGRRLPPGPYLETCQGCSLVKDRSSSRWNTAW